MDERTTLRKMAAILHVDIEDLPRTLQRFKKEIEELSG